MRQETALSCHMRCSNTYSDIMGLQDDYANLNTEEDRDYLMVKVHELIFFFQAEDGIRDVAVTGVQTCALPIFGPSCTTGELTSTTASAPTVTTVPSGLLLRALNEGHFSTGCVSDVAFAKIVLHHRGPRLRNPEISTNIVHHFLYVDGTHTAQRVRLHIWFSSSSGFSSGL